MTTNTSNQSLIKTYESDLKKNNQEVFKIENALKAAKQTRGHTQRELNKAKGIEPVIITFEDLMLIVPKILSNKKPTSKVFNELEVSYKKCNRWAERAVKRKPYKDYLSAVIETLILENNSELLLMKKHDVYQLNPILAADSYNAAFTQMKVQLKLARIIELLEITIEDQVSEIDLLKESMAAFKGDDRKESALKLKILHPGMSVSDIAKKIGLGRTTVSAYFNQDDNKAKINESKAIAKQTTTKINPEITL
jgi:DNA-binding XRE family transcriptional regulator